MDLQHVRVLVAQLYQGMRTCAGWKSVFKNSMCKPPGKRYTANSPPNELTLRSVERSYAHISINSHLSVDGVKIADFASSDENEHSASAPS